MPIPTKAVPIVVNATAVAARAGPSQVLLFANSPNQTATRSMYGAILCRTGASEVAMMIPILSSDASRLVCVPERPLIAVANFSPTVDAPAMPSRIAPNPSTPADVRIAAARMASVPKIPLSAASFDA